MLVEILYEDLGECCGGLLHIVLDDGNLEDHHILWCRAQCDKRENWDRHDRLLCRRIANEMLCLVFAASGIVRDVRDGLGQVTRVGMMALEKQRAVDVENGLRIQVF